MGTEMGTNVLASWQSTALSNNIIDLNASFPEISQHGPRGFLSSMQNTVLIVCFLGLP